jgi:hypothetical protein
VVLLQTISAVLARRIKVRPAHCLVDAISARDQLPIRIAVFIAIDM